jgi:hypothetical protein
MLSQFSGDYFGPKTSYLTAIFNAINFAMNEDIVFLVEW